MKELSIEEKAKRYDEAYKKVAVRFGSNVADEIFLKESEDEKIRKEIKIILANTDFSQFALDYTFADMIAWLEKQGKEKRAEWGEDDEAARKDIIDKLKRIKMSYVGGSASEICQMEIDWLKSLKGRVQQPKQEWSEEDEHWRQKAVDFMKYPDWIKTTPTLAKGIISWLKSLKPQNRWKPSDEQIEAISIVAKHGFVGESNMKILEKLLEQLKAFYQ